MNDDIDIILDDFRSEIQRDLEAGMSEDELKKRVLTLILLLFALGSGYEESSQITGDDREWLDEMFKLTSASARGIVERASDGSDMEDTAIKLSNHSLGAYHWALIVNGAPDDEDMLWDLGPTEHCGDCHSYAALGWRPVGEWKVIALERMHYPQSPFIECKGLHCQCRMRQRNAES